MCDLLLGKGNYVYQPLPSKNSIRLLELVPSTDKSRIRCSLETFELENAPTFKALSYTWGHSEITIKRPSISARHVLAQCVSRHRDARLPDHEDEVETIGRARRHRIICDDRLMKVTGNLRDALHMLGNSINMPLMPKTPTYYWVDALCVDQQNVLERNAQVARMADIFHKASGVVVWLGREDDFTADALEVIHKVSAIPETDWSSVPYTSFYDSVEITHSSKPDLTYHHWLGFIALINRPWFRRAWVVQEITLDPTIRRTTGLPSWVPDYSVSIDPYPLRYRGKGFWRASGHNAWHMNVFTMENGLLDVQGYRVGYIDQISILSDELHDPSASWASIVRLALSLDLPYPDPSGSGKKPSRVEVLWRTLTTDTYAHVSPAPPEAGTLFIDYILNLQIRHRLMPWSSTDEFQPHHSPLSESIYPEWRTLLSLEPVGSAYSLETYKRRLTAVVEDMFDGTYSPIGLAQLQHELEQSGGKKRRLFKTQNGYLGTGPRSLKTGDEIWVLHRGGLPFVLRRQQKFGHYRLIGEAFVYGVMHGEALQSGAKAQNLTLE
ncbi:hypothetical protein SLS61_009774 [Didymella pomorum]